MKAHRKLFRAAGRLVAVAVALLVLRALAYATVGITLNNAALVSYSLAPGAASSPITPAANTSVWVMGVQTATGEASFGAGGRGVGLVTMLHSAGNFLEWVGGDYASGGTNGSFSSTPGTHVISLDSGGLVDIEVASADTFIVKNLTGGPTLAKGEVTLLW